jgi:beta-lactamase regulating signal transducer with metallopeptidase domain
MDFAALQHSVFLQALGSAILNSLWQCFIVWLIYETISISYKSASAKFKNNLSTILLFFCFAWFVTSFVSKIISYENVPAVAAANVLHQSTVYDVSGFKRFLTYASSTLPYLSVAYIFLLFFLVFRLFAAYRYVYFISKKNFLRSTDELNAFASKVAKQIGITKKITVWISHYLDVPATIGFIKPVILIPLASINNLSSQQLEAIILHELSHIKRNDYITNLVISIIETILFFNPFVVLLSTVIKRERENCCDDFVLQYRYDPHSYASALLRLEQSRTSKLKLAIGAVSDKKQLLSRIKRITNGKAISKQFNYGQKLLALFLITFCICSVAWLSPAEKKSSQQKAVVKEIPSNIQKVRLSDDVKSSSETVNTRQNESVSSIAMKQNAAPKTNAVTFTESDKENFPSADFYDENKTKEDNPDFFTAENITEKSGTNKLPQPLFFFDEKNLKLPSVINIQNFPFQSMGFNIDLSKIDLESLNQNLKEAFKQINGVDWKKVENDIRKSFPEMKIKNFTQKQLNAISDAKVFTELNNLFDRKQSASNAYLMQLKRTLLAQDSLREAQLVLINENNEKATKQYQKLREFYTDNSSYKYYYSNAEPDISEGAKDDCPEKNISPVSRKRNIRIDVRNGQAHSGTLNERKHFVFSFSDDTEKPNQKHINIEVSDLP